MERKQNGIYFKLLLIKLFRSDTVKMVLNNHNFFSIMSPPVFDLFSLLALTICITVLRNANKYSIHYMVFSMM